MSKYYDEVITVFLYISSVANTNNIIQMHTWAYCNRGGLSETTIQTVLFSVYSPTHAHMNLILQNGNALSGSIFKCQIPKCVRIHDGYFIDRHLNMHGLIL